MRRLLAFVFIASIAAHALAADDPVTAKGFQPGQLYRFGDLAHINLFNGALNIVLPIGQTYHVDGNLSYGLTLAYSGNNWERASVVRRTCVGEIVDGNCTDYQDKTFWHNAPTLRSNAGLGWYLSTGGELVPSDRSTTTALNSLQTADTARYEFYGDADHSTSSSAAAAYSDRASYARMTNCPDLANCKDVELADGTIRRFLADREFGPPSDIRDRFGNHASLLVSTASGAPVWTLTDSYRTQTVTFERLTVPTNDPDADRQFYDVVKTITLAAFNGTTATYTFHYTPDSSGVDQLTKIYRPSIAGDCQCNDNLIPAMAWAPLLTSITLPDQTTFVMTMNVGSTLDSQLSGNLTSLTLPTLGKYEWSYESKAFPSQLKVGGPYPTGGIINIPDNMSYTVGVQEQVKKDASGSRIERTTYSTAGNRPVLGDSQASMTTVSVFQPGSSPSADVLLSRSVHYFDVRGGNALDTYGLPFSVVTPTWDTTLQQDSIPNPDPSSPSAAPRYISSKSYDGAGNLMQYSYVAYVGSVVGGSLSGPEVVSERTVSRTPNGEIWSSTDSSDSDGLGHFRTVVTDGNFPGANRRTTTTKWNSGDASVGTVGSGGAWIINTYTSRTVTEGSSTTKELACFDSQTGALLRRRLLTNASGAGSHDVVQQSTFDTKGNLVAEDSFGGDAQTVGTDALCTTALTSSAAEYRVKHQYKYGSRSLTTPIIRGSTNDTVIFNAFEAPDTAATASSPARSGIDQNTGLVATSADTAGIKTSLEYDSMGRLTSVAPTGAASTAYTYTAASGTDGPRVRAVTGTGDSSIDLTYIFDTFGRVIQEQQVMPAPIGSTPPTVSTRETKYDAAGRKWKVSELEPTPSHYTEYLYDALGRPTSVTAPDGGQTVVTYPGGPSATTTTTRVRTSATTDTAVSRTERHDRFGRIAEVTEPAGPTSSSNTTGATVTTTYAYDAADRLVGVRMSGSEPVVQARTFTYDGRGFLIWESHPESGMAAYTRDSRGNVLSTFRGAAATLLDLRFVYDGAGQITEVDGRNPLYLAGSADPDRQTQFRPIKTFTYGDFANSPEPATDHRRGKLWSATRYNYPPDAGGFVSSDTAYRTLDVYRVTETYSYGDDVGRRTKRQTSIDRKSFTGAYESIRSIDQSIAYDAMSAPAVVNYPSCIGCALPDHAPLQNFALTYSHGRIIGGDPFVTSITYWPNGMRRDLTHSNGITDTQTPQAAMARPLSLTSRAYDACDAPVITSQPFGGSIAANQNITLTVVAANADAYQWFALGNGGQGWQSIGTGNAVTVHPSETTLYYAAVTNKCRDTQHAVTSRTVTVSVGDCTPAQLVSVTGSRNADGTVSLSASTGGTDPITVQWYRVDGTTDVSIGSGTALTAAAITTSTTYKATATNSCNTSGVSNTIVVAVPLPAPSGVDAKKSSGASAIAVSWTAVTNASSYIVERRNGATWQQVASPTSPQFTDTSVASGGTYAYRVRAFDSVSSTSSPASAADVATMLVFTPAVSGTTISLAPMNDALQAVNAVRSAAGLPVVDWTSIIVPGTPAPATGAVVAAAQLNALRGRMNEALQMLGVPVTAYSDPDPQNQLVRAADINEIQQRAQ